jgi:CBS domain-containing protein
MQVQEIMTNSPAFCTPDMDLQQAAKMMKQCDCGAMPVVEDEQSKRLVGIITDRDIICRSVAEGYSPFAALVADHMTSPVYAVTPDMDLDDCIRVMETHQVRRLPVRDRGGRCCGMVAQADIARWAPERDTAEMVKELSQPPSPMLH